MKHSRTVYVPSGVSSFFEICDRLADGTKIEDPLHVGARGGGFIIAKGTTTIATTRDDLSNDEVWINGVESPEAKTSRAVVRLIRNKHPIPLVRVSHSVIPPIGQGFGTSGAGALSTAIAIGDLFDLKFTLGQASNYAHIAEIENLTGLGTVISLASGTGAIGLVTEPGSFSVGKTDAIICDPENYILVCATFGAISKPSILSNETSRRRINEFGRKTQNAILDDPTPEKLLSQSRLFSEKSGLASPELLKLCDRALEFGALGATPNMIGNAIHCLIEKSGYISYMEKFSGDVPKDSLFESNLIQSGPRFKSGSP
jgi:pantoate kinase